MNDFPCFQNFQRRDFLNPIYPRKDEWCVQNLKNEPVNLFTLCLFGPRSSGRTYSLELQMIMALMYKTICYACYCFMVIFLRVEEEEAWL